MEQSRLVRYISELSAKDRDRFWQFVISPFFNQHQKTIELLEIIMDQVDRSAPCLDKGKVFGRLFPGEPFDEQKLHNVMSYLKKLYLKFLSQIHFEQQDFEEELQTVALAYENNQFDLLKNRARQLEKNLSRHPYHDSNYHLANYRLYNFLGYYSGHYEDRASSEFFQLMLDGLDRYYIVEKLRHCCHLTANMMMMNTHYDFRLLDELIAHLDENWDEFKEDKSIALYYTILLSLQEEDNLEHYHQLKHFLEYELDSLSKQEQQDLYEFANNYCIRKINQGYKDYFRELFQLYKQGLRTEVILDKGLISEWNYKNITALGCSLKEFEWTENFIQEYKDKLPAHRRDNAYNYNLAHLYYTKKLYPEALSALLHVQFTDVKYHLNTSFLMLRTYFAMKDTEALLSLIETFRIYVIRNQKMATEQKRGYTNFLRFAKKLVLLKHQSAAFSRRSLQEKLDSLYKKIEGTSNVINKYWLLDECRADV